MTPQTEPILAYAHHNGKQILCEITDAIPGWVRVKSLEKPFLLVTHRLDSMELQEAWVARELIEVHPDTLSRWGVVDKDGFGHLLPVMAEMKEMVMA